MMRHSLPGRDLLVLGREPSGRYTDDSRDTAVLMCRDGGFARDEGLDLAGVVACDG